MERVLKQNSFNSHQWRQAQSRASANTFARHCTSGSFPFWFWQPAFHLCADSTRTHWNLFNVFMFFTAQLCKISTRHLTQRTIISVCPAGGEGRVHIHQHWEGKEHHSRSPVCCPIDLPPLFGVFRCSFSASTAPLRPRKTGKTKCKCSQCKYKQKRWDVITLAHSLSPSLWRSLDNAACTGVRGCSSRRLYKGPFIHGEPIKF